MEHSSWIVSAVVEIRAVDRNGHVIEFVRGSCKGLGMANQKNEELMVHVLQARWFGERLERMNEALSQLSGVFIGFLGIELALLGQVAIDPSSKNNQASKLASVAAIGLVISIFLFLTALWSTKFEMPSLIGLRDTWDNSEYSKLKAPLKLLTDENGREGNILKSLFEENEHLNRYYRAGTISAGCSQLFILAFVLTRWN